MSQNALARHGVHAVFVLCQLGSTVALRVARGTTCELFVLRRERLPALSALRLR